MANEKNKPDTSVPATPAKEKKPTNGPEAADTPAADTKPANPQTAAKEETAVPLKRETEAKTRPGYVRLHELVMDKPRFCRRDDDEFSEISLVPLRENIVIEGGINVPVEYAMVDWKKMLIRGHRRVTVLRMLANSKVAGFSLDMEIPAVEVIDATPTDLLMRSIGDNHNRRPTKGLARVREVKLCVESGVADFRAASCMQISMQSYRRDKIIAVYEWMYNLILEHKMPQTKATLLLEEAVKVDRASDLKEMLHDWVAEQELDLEEKERIQREKTGKDMRPTDKHVKKRLTDSLVAHWVRQLRNKQQLSTKVARTFPVDFDPAKEEVRIGNQTYSLANETPDETAIFASKIMQLGKNLGPYIVKKYELSKLAESGVSADEPYDINFLRALGLGSLATQLTARAQAQAGEHEASDEGEAGDEPADPTDDDHDDHAAKGE